MPDQVCVFRLDQLADSDLLAISFRSMYSDTYLLDVPTHADTNEERRLYDILNEPTFVSQSRRLPFRIISLLLAPTGIYYNNYIRDSDACLCNIGRQNDATDAGTRWREDRSL